jgi:hypothetical protein
MPIMKCEEDGKPGFKWGETGKCYIYTDDDSKRNALYKAKQQGEAIKINQATSDKIQELHDMGYKPIAFSSQDIGIGQLFEGTITLSDMSIEKIQDGELVRRYDVVDAIAAVGDRFYGELYVPADTLKASAMMWNQTYNDISHLGTMFPAGMSAVENIEYITGYNTDAVYDEAGKAIKVKMHINHDAPKYNVWKNFMDINKDSKRVPNVSIFGFYKAKNIRKNTLPSGTYIPISASHSEYVVAMTDMIPVAITTCLRGKCDDKAGCGISTGFQDNSSCECVPKVEMVKQDDERLNYLKDRIKKVKK